MKSLLNFFCNFNWHPTIKAFCFFKSTLSEMKSDREREDS